MTCTNVRKFIYAFADGQLAVKENCEMLDHLKLCPECSRLVDEHQALRGCVGRQLAVVAAPAALRARIENSVLCGSGPAMSGKRRAWRSRPALAAAACVVIAAGAVLWRSLPVGASRVTPVPRGESAATMIAAVHCSCCAHPEMHQCKSLPRNLREVRHAICDHFDDKVAALAPDLSRFGYAFESANFCGVRDKPGCEGGHLIYVHGSNRRLSFFSVPRWDCLDKSGRKGDLTGGDYREYCVDRDDGRRLHILAWHNDATTYICCGGEENDILEDMIQGVRSAMIHAGRQVQLAMLRGDRGFGE